MIEFTKSEKRELRRLAGEVYKAEMEKEVAKLEAAFKTWSEGKITVFDLDEQIHEYYSGPRKQLYGFYQMRNQHYFLNRQRLHNVVGNWLNWFEEEKKS